nr:cyclopropane-fatty-acyl-phospholipid synthase family protein [Sphingomonas rubra]
MLDRIDRGLEAGAIEATLPDGTARLLGGRREGPVAIVAVHRWRALRRLALGGSAGWYEAWAAGDWSSPDPVPLFDLFMRNRLSLGSAARAKGTGRLLLRGFHALRPNSRRGARANIAFHYDLGNDFYATWLDPTMSYSSAMFDGADEQLEAAQRRKVARLLDRLRLRDGAAMLEIGCGWGFLAGEAAARGARVTALTLSAEQAEVARGRAGAGVVVELTDYRDVRGRFDAIASVEMVEAIGIAQWRTYLEAIARLLVPGGRAGLQFISIADDVFDAYAANADFIQRYVFPGGLLISERRFRALAEACGLEWTDPVAFGIDYAETLRRWRLEFDAADADGRLPTRLDARFKALWRYYLMYCEGGFRGGGIDVAQVTLVKR